MAPPARILAELYAVPPSAFTRERNARAAALAKAGKADEARAVKQLRRPPASLWAVNQLARAAPRELEAFLEAARRLRATQLRDPRAAAEAVREHRTHLGALVEQARGVLRGEEYHPTPAIERRISDTLLGAAADGRLAEDLREGGLAAEMQAPGFDALMGAPGAGLRLVRASPTKETSPEKRARPSGPKPSTSEKPVSNADDEGARQRAQALAQEAAARQAAAQQLEREITAAAGALTEQRRRLRDARREARRAAAAVQKAGRKVRRGR
jgi:hypothetical protein